MLLAYRIAVHDSTWFSHYTPFFSRELIHPIDVQFPILLPILVDALFCKYSSALRQTLDLVQEHAIQILSNVKSGQKTYHDRSVMAEVFDRRLNPSLQPDYTIMTEVSNAMRRTIHRRKQTSGRSN